MIEAAKRGLERSVAIVHAEMKRGLSGSRHDRFDGAVRRTVRHGDRHHQRVQRHFEHQQSDRSVGGRRRYRGSPGHHRVSVLLVAVPAVWAFNYFTNKVEAFDVEMDNSSMELINYFITASRRKEVTHGAYKPKAAPVMAAPNVIPMADIMLVLLIIFMVVTPMLQKGMSGGHGQG